MAEKRMFSQKIIDSDAFLDMPLSTQAVYFHLSMRADDEGFINNPKKILRMIGGSDDEIKLLVAKRYILDLGTGIVVIKHWFVHNYIRRDRVKETAHTKERALITLQDNDIYTECQAVDGQVAGKCQARVEESRGDKSRVVESSKEKKSNLPKNLNLEAFHQWCDYKGSSYRQQGKTLSANKLAKFTHKEQQEMVDNSIMNNYKGLFEIKNKKSFSKEASVGSLEWERQQMLGQSEVTDAELI